MKKYSIIAMLSLAVGFGVGFGININQPTPISPKPVAMAPAPAPIARPIIVTAMPSSIATSQVTLEAIWTAGGSDYRKAVNTLVDEYAAKMDGHCDVAGFNIGAAVAAYGAFVPHGAEDTFRSIVKKQIVAMACEEMNGARAVAILQS